MAVQAGRAYVTVSYDPASAKRIQAQTASQSGIFLKGWKDAALKAGAAIGGIFAAEKIGEFLKESVEGAANVQKSMEAVHAEFGRAGQAAIDFGEHASKQFGISEKDSLAFSAQIGLMAKNLGLGKAKGEQMAEGLQKVAGAVGLIRGQDPTKYFSALNTALLGNTRGLKAMGIAVNSANEAQTAERLGFIKTTVDANQVAEAHDRVKVAAAKLADTIKQYGRNSTQALSATATLKSEQESLSRALAGSPSSTFASLTAAQRAQVIYAIATQKSSSLQAQAAQHSGDLADQMIILKAELSDVSDEIGAVLLPVATSLVGTLARDLPGSIRATASAFQEISSAIPTPALEALGIIVGTYVVGAGAMVIANSSVAASFTGAGAGIISYGVDLAAVTSEVGIANGALILLGDTVDGIGALIAANPLIAIGVGVAAVAGVILTLRDSVNLTAQAEQQATAATQGLHAAWVGLRSDSLNLRQAQDEHTQAVLQYNDAQRQVNKLQAEGKTGTEAYSKAVVQARLDYDNVAQSAENVATKQKTVAKDTEAAKKAMQDQVTTLAHEGQVARDTALANAKWGAGFLTESQRATAGSKQFAAQTLSTARAIETQAGNMNDAQRRAGLLNLAAHDLTVTLGHVPSAHQINVFYRNNMQQLISQAAQLRLGIQNLPVNKNILIEIDEVVNRTNFHPDLAGSRAPGGPVYAGESYLVGEKGPEIYTPDRNGRIIPNNEISGGTAGHRMWDGMTPVIENHIYIDGKPVEVISERVVRRYDKQISRSIQARRGAVWMPA